MGSVQGSHTSTDDEARTILARVVDLGGVVSWVDGLKVGNAGVIPEDLRAQWREHKAYILALLTATPPPCAVCGKEGFVYAPDGTTVCVEHEERWS